MFARLQKIRAAYDGYSAFCSLPLNRRRVVFYSEGRGYWTYFAPVFHALREKHHHEVIYVTSGVDDPILQAPPQGLLPFYIGLGAIRTLFFSTLKAKVVVMTMPDLQTFHIKRSPHNVSYVYLHHSLNSTHMVYRPAAFDNFDGILCVGPYHVEEIRAREAQLGLPQKVLIKHGYGRLDALLDIGITGPRATKGERPQVLVAPSWGPNGLIERYGLEAVRSLIETGFKAILRPHPRTRKSHGHVLDAIGRHYAQEANFQLDENTDSIASLLDSDVMVSDWSGAASEFAFGLERPVLYVDVPRKVNNPDYGSLRIEPFEVHIRQQIGRVISPDRLDRLGHEVADMLRTPETWRDAIRRARDRWIYNPGSSGGVAADYIAFMSV